MANYTVSPGDTLYGIARRFGTTVDNLMALNGLQSTALSVGQSLMVSNDAPDNPVAPSPQPDNPWSQPQPQPQPEPSWQQPSQPDNPWSQPQQPDNSWQQPEQPVSSGGSDYLSARQQFSTRIQPDNGFNRYFMTVPLPDGSTITAAMRDNLTNSHYMVYPNGISYAGQSSMALNLDDITSVGLNPQQAAALQYVSTHEGQFDAINSYDKGIFSYGFIQFVGSAAAGGSLNRLLASMKAYAPGSFARIFQAVGIDSTGGTTTVLDESGNLHQGDDAWVYIQRTVSLYGAFIQAAYDPQLNLEQLRMANVLYVQPALSFHLNINIAGFQITIPRLQDVLSSEGVLTLVIALAVNQGVGGMSRIMADAVGRVAAQSQLYSSSALAQINQQQVVETIASTTPDDRVRNRANGVLQSGLSFV
jgi:peptidoglycan endopeptidase LytF